MPMLAVRYAAIWDSSSPSGAVLRFDDRLATVLAQPVAQGVMTNAQFAQLIDLVAQRDDKDHVASSLDAAMDRIDQLQAIVPVRSRAAAVAGIGKKLRSARLTAHLAQDDYAVAGLAMRAAHLSDDAWVQLIPTLPVRARGLLRNRQDLGPKALRALDQHALGDRALPSASATSEALSAPIEAPQPPRTEIGHIVERIEAFRKSRHVPPTTQPVLELALDEERTAELASPDVIAFETDRTGSIAWVDAPAAHGLIGLSVVQPGTHDWLDTRARTAFSASRAVRNGMMTLDAPPMLAGQWQLDATPSFDIISGQCRGHHGVMRRLPAIAQPVPMAAADRQVDQKMHDSLRQIIHELRTPLNVISGFSEIIESQLFGPASFAYRALAEDIGRDSRQLLDQVNDLDSAFRLGPGQSANGKDHVDAAPLLANLVAAHRPVFESKGARLLHVPASSIAPLAMTDSALQWALDRLLAILARASGQADAVSLVTLIDPADSRKTQWVVALPSAMAALPVGALFDSAHDFSTPGCDNPMSGAGFTLRMIANLLESWGGGLVRVDDQMVMTLPMAADASPERIMASA